MSPRSRKTIAAVFLAGFILAAPIIILATKGYRYNWKKGRLEKTGIIKTDSQPTGAAVWLNGLQQDKTTPTSLFRLLPEDYEVRLEKPGYFPWTKILHVRSGETAFTENVKLMSDSMPTLLAAGEMTGSAFTADGRTAAVLKRGPEWTELLAYRRPSNEPTVLARFARDKYSNVELTWSPRGDTLLFQAELADGRREIYLYPLAPAGGALALHENVTAAGRLTARWSSDGSLVTVVTDRGVFTADPKDGVMTPAILSPRAQDAAAVGGDLYLLETESDKVVLEKMPTTGGQDSITPVVELPTGRYAFVAADEKYLILADGAADRSLLLETPTGQLVQTFAAKQALWEKPPGGGRLLLWNDFEISVFDPATAQTQLINRLGMPLLGCVWLPDGRNVAYAWTEGVQAVELDDRDRRNVYDLARFNGISVLAVDPTDKSLIFIGAAGNQRGLYEKKL